MATDSARAAARGRARERLRYGWLSVVAALVVFAGKIVAYLMTDSSAVLSDAMESVVNVVAAAMLLFSLRIAAQPADEDHPYGHGKVEFFSAGIEAAFIFFAGVLILVEATDALWHGAEPQDLGAGLLVLAAFSLINLGLGFALTRAGRRLGSMALVADGKHVLVDVWTSAGVIAGLVVVALTSQSWLDPVIALVVGAHILRAGWKLGRDAVDGLMDAADEQQLADITQTLEDRRAEDWIDVHGLRSWRSGNTQHIDFHLVVPRYYDVERLHHIHDIIEHALGLVDGHHGDVVVHFDPCANYHCASCIKRDCPVRSQVCHQRPALSVDRVRRRDELVEA